MELQMKEVIMTLYICRSACQSRKPSFLGGLGDEGIGIVLNIFYL